MLDAVEIDGRPLNSCWLNWAVSQVNRGQMCKGVIQQEGMALTKPIEKKERDMLRYQKRFSMSIVKSESGVGWRVRKWQDLRVV